MKIKYYHIVRYVKQFKNSKKVFTFMSNLQTYCHFKLDFQKVDQLLSL